MSGVLPDRESAVDAARRDLPDLAIAVVAGAGHEFLRGRSGVIEMGASFTNVALPAHLPWSPPWD